MKKLFSTLLILLLAVLCALALFGCTGGDGPDDGQTYPEDELPLEGLVLIRKNVAQFRVVIASGVGSEGRRAASELVDRLRELSIEIEDAVEDKSIGDVTDCEIIIGVGAKNREGCAVEASELGELGYVIKAVGSRIVIAGGTPTLTRSTVKSFMENQLGITDDTTSKRNVAVSPELNIFVPTDYSIDRITVASNDLSSYVIACDENDSAVFPDTVNKIKQKIRLMSGYDLPIKDNRDVASGAKRVIVRTVADAGEDGFRVYVEGADLVIETSIPAMLESAVDDFLKDTFNGNKTTLAFDKEYLYTKHVLTVTYSDFGAVGDGKTDDFFAILKTHQHANITKQKVVAENKTYYIGKTWSEGVEAKTIYVKTDVDFGEATFIIDDTVEGIHEEVNRRTDIFTIARDNNFTLLEKEQIANLTSNPVIRTTDTSIPWLAELLTEDKNLVILENSNKRDYIRFGGNENQGNTRSDILIVDGDGVISKETPVIFDFNDITVLKFVSANDNPITVKGGKFKTVSAKCAPKHANTEYTEYEAYARGIKIIRSNTVVSGIDHQVVSEPDKKGYPYTGFIHFLSTYNSTITDSKLFGHSYYLGGKDAVEWAVPMGTYDLIMEDSINVYCKNLTQYRDIKDARYWGICSSNGCKNLNFDNVKLSMIDAHCGVWGMNISNSVIGRRFNIIGGGVLNVTNTVKRCGASFVLLRADYGATFNGTMNFKNCHLNAYEEWDSSTVSTFPAKYIEGKACIIESEFDPAKTYEGSDGKTRIYKNWDFGYRCYLPQYINIDNFTIGSDDKKTKVKAVHVFNDIPDAAFSEDIKNGSYKITQKITYKNMDKPYACTAPEGDRIIRSIKFEQKT
ncbi:MAG: hypothetical protein J6L90_03995 [Clostridia bacterium]|nr:hypothetical protein [Clostridia bacterium]